MFTDPDDPDPTEPHPCVLRVPAPVACHLHGRWLLDASLAQLDEARLAFVLNPPVWDVPEEAGAENPWAEDLPLAA